MNRPPQASTTKSTTSKTSLAAEIQETNAKTTISRDDRNDFLSAITEAKANGPQAGEILPHIEASAEVIAHFMGGLPANWKETRCVVFHDVKVYEAGFREVAKTMESKTVEEKNFGHSRR